MHCQPECHGRVTVLGRPIPGLPGSLRSGAGRQIQVTVDSEQGWNRDRWRTETVASRDDGPEIYSEISGRSTRSHDFAKLLATVVRFKFHSSNSAQDDDTSSDCEEFGSTGLHFTGTLSLRDRTLQVYCRKYFPVSLYFNLVTVQCFNRYLVC